MSNASPPDSPDVRRAESRPVYTNVPTTPTTPETSHHAPSRRIYSPPASEHQISSPLYYSRSVGSTSTMAPPPEYLSRSQWNGSGTNPTQETDPDRLERVDSPSFTRETSRSAYQPSSSSVEIEIHTLPNSPVNQAHQPDSIKPSAPHRPFYQSPDSDLDLHHRPYAAHTFGQTGSDPLDVNDHEKLASKSKHEPELTSPNLHFTEDEHTDTDQDGQGFDDYDWDNDDDLEGDVRFDDLNDRKRGQHQHHRRRTLARRLSPYNVIKFLITTFIGNIFICLALIVPPLFLGYGGYLQHGDSESAAHSRYVHDNVAAWMYWASYNLLCSWALYLLVELAPKVFIMLVNIIWGDVHENIKSKVEIFHTAKQWLKNILYAAMLWGSWVIIFNGIFGLHSPSETEKSKAEYTDVVVIVVQLLFFFTLVLSLEKLLLLSISMSFHQVAYSDRIQKVTQALAVLDILQDYRPKRKSHPGMTHSRSHSGDILTLKAISAQLTSPSKKGFEHDATFSSMEPPKTRWWQRKKIDRALKNEKDQTTILEMSPKNESGRKADSANLPFNLTKSMSDDPYRVTSPNKQDSSTGHDGRPAIKRRNSQTTFAVIARRGASAAKIARAAMKDPVSVVGKKSGLALDINNPTEAKKLARRIFFSFRSDANRNYLIPSDFYPAFPTEELAKKAFSIFDSDGNGDISRTEVKNEIFRVYKERRALSQSLQDVGHAIGRLDGIMLGIAAIVFLFIALEVVRIDISKTLTSVYTIGVAAAFVFKGTAANVFDSIIMVFCTHPFDTGDRIIMDNAGVEEILVVKQMGLLVTVFLRWDGTEWFAPNSLIGQKFIINLRRSNSQFENATVQFGWDTPLEKIDELEEKMNDWLQTDEQRRFEPGTAAVIQHLVNQQYIEITFGMIHRENWQDWGARWNRRTAFHAAINYYSRQLGITFYGSEQPVEMRNWNNLKHHLLDDDDDDEPLNDQDGNQSIQEQKEIDEYENPRKEKVKIPDQNINNNNQVEGKGSEIRLPEVLGFSPPPESGTGMRKRRKFSKKKAMLGDS
ncbi:Mechanosensitive ion channel-domain-containing protein [Melampsora americana]|nr:Mechanosensitive ion channel-domain-containing protein [Melampsora americana]